MIKFILILLLMALIIYIGYKVKQGYEKRRKILRDFLLIFSRLKTEIVFNLKPVNQVLNSIESEIGQDTKIIVNKFVKSGEDEFKVKSIYLKPRDEEILTEFFSALGRTDVFSQTAIIENSSALLKERLNESEEETRTKGNLAFKLILCLAVVVGILFI